MIKLRNVLPLPTGLKIDLQCENNDCKERFETLSFVEKVNFIKAEIDKYLIFQNYDIESIEINVKTLTAVIKGKI